MTSREHILRIQCIFLREYLASALTALSFSFPARFSVSLKGDRISTSTVWPGLSQSGDTEEKKANNPRQMSRVTGHAVPVWDKRRESEKRSAASPSRTLSIDFPCCQLGPHRDGGWSSASAIHFVWIPLPIRLAPLPITMVSRQQLHNESVATEQRAFIPRRTTRRSCGWSK